MSRAVGQILVKYNLQCTQWRRRCIYSNYCYFYLDIISSVFTKIPAYTSLHFQTTLLPIVSHKIITKISQGSDDTVLTGKLSGNSPLCCSHAIVLSEGLPTHTSSAMCWGMRYMTLLSASCGLASAQEGPHWSFSGTPHQQLHCYNNCMV